MTTINSTAHVIGNPLSSSPQRRGLRTIQRCTLHSISTPTSSTTMSQTDCGDARNEETDFQGAVDDSDYDPEEDAHDQDDGDSEEEITRAGDQE